jgi:hypothetical protein
MSEKNNKPNAVAAIKAYFANGPGAIPLREGDNGARSELMEAGSADKAFFRELKDFCVAECDRLSIDY